jgi:tetratricopeptide (TPR) repeat protein
VTDGSKNVNLIKTEKLNIMKTLNKIATIIFTLLAFSGVAQNDPMKNVQAIADLASQKCDGPIWGLGEDSVKAVTNYSLYREYLKQDNFKDAVVGWRYVFFNAPAARQTTHIDGIAIFEEFAKKAEGAAKEAYIDTLLAIYEVRMNCFGKTPDQMMRKTFAWFTHRKAGNDELVYELFNKTFDMYNNDKETSKYDISPAFLYPWVAMAVTVNKMKKIDDDKVFEIYELVNEIADHNMIKGNNVGQFKGASDKVTDFLDKYGYLDCNSLVDLATKKYNANKNDVSNILNAYKILRGGKCYDAPIFMEIAEKVVKEQPSTQLYTFLAKRYSDNKNWDKAIDYLLKAADMEEDKSAKAGNFYTVAQFYQQKGDFPSARTYANRAAELRPGWGDPYILIGRLYASSGSRCGSGTGWDSQVVVWAAIDMWNKAKSVDPSAAAEAQKLINQYAQYMPSQADVFMRPDVEVGGSYTIGCWINVTTTVRVN